MNPILWVLAIVAVIFWLMIWGKVFRKPTGWKTFVLVTAIALTVYSVVGILGSYQVIDLSKMGAEGLFLASTGVAPSATCPTGQTMIGGVCTVAGAPSGAVAPTGSKYVIGTLKVTSTEKNSKSHSNVGSGASQWLKIYDQATDPSSPTASYIDRINISSGSGTSTNKLLTTNTPYRVVFDGASTWYDKDFLVMSFDSAKYNSYSSELLFDMGDIIKVTTIDDVLTEIEGTNGDVNGATNSSAIANEIYGSATDTLLYNSTNGDGQFYIKPTLSFSGAYTEAKNPVLCFLWDTTNPPEGNEISSIVYQLVSGTDYKIPSELVNYWSNQECVALGASASGGSSSQIKLTFTYDESNLNANDDWYLYLDDLGDIRGKDAIISNTGATFDSVKFDALV